MNRRTAAAVLVIAGTDSSGGAGLVRDVCTLRDLGVEALCAVTAVTAQSHRQFRSSHPVPPERIFEQMLAALESRDVQAIKIGMLGSAAAVEAVAEGLEQVPHVPVVLDPVLRSTSGGVLLDATGETAMRRRLFPLTAVLTPNIPEAAHLVGAGQGEAADCASLLGWATKLLAQGPKAVLIKGGHAGGAEAADLLADSAGQRCWLTSARLPGAMRGSGCALASGIAAGLALGQPLAAACEAARQYVLGQMGVRD